MIHIFQRDRHGAACLPASLIYLVAALIGISFVSPGEAAPIVTPASVFASNTVAIVTATVNPNGTATTAWFEWGLTTNYTAQTTPVSVGSGGAPVPFSAQISVSPGLVYYGRVVALDSHSGLSPSSVTFGTPQLSLNGPAVVTNVFGTSFVETATITIAPLALAAGSRHSVILRRDHSIVAWGDNFLGQTNVPAGATNVTAITGGGYHNLALRADGTIVGWGWNSAGQASVPAGLTNVTSIAAGEEHSLAARADGTVVAWGNNTYGQASVPAGLSNVVAVAAGMQHSLALRRDGTVVAWGQNTSGQTNVPPGLTNVIAIDGGQNHSLALCANGSVVRWGQTLAADNTITVTNGIAIACGYAHSLALGANGIIVTGGAGTNGETTVPAGLTNASMIIAGYYHNLAVSFPDGTIFAWGKDSYGQTDVPPYATGSPVVPTGSVNPTVPGAYVLTYTVTNALGGFSTLTRTVVVQLPVPTLVILTPTGVSNNVASLHATVNPNTIPTTAWFEWGFFANHLTHRTAPVNVGAGTNSVPLDAGLTNLLPGANYFVRVVTTNAAGITRGNAVFFGSPAITLNGSANLTNEIGTAYIEAGATAYESPFAIRETQVHDLILRRDSTMRAWGNNLLGQLSIPAVAGTNIAAIAAGLAQDVALKSDGTVYSWGGDIVNDPQVSPILSKAKAIAAGGAHQLAVLSNGGVVAWGYNTGFGETNIPAGLNNVVAVAVGDYHNVALRSDGTVAAWGKGNLGQTNVPAGLSNVERIAAGQDFSLALRWDGTVVGWGDNTYGQTNVPAGLSNVVDIAIGETHCLALRGDGTVIAWGANDLSQAIVPAGLSNVVAIAAGISHNLVMQADGTLVGWGTNATTTPIDLTPSLDYRTITAPISISGSINTNVPGTYVLNYTVTNSFGAVAAASRTVVMVLPAPRAATLAAHTTNSIASMNALVNPRNQSTTAWFEWGQIQGFYPRQTPPISIGSGTNDVPFTALITGLTPGSIYRGRVVAVHADGGIGRGKDVLFGAPSVSLNGPAAITNKLGAAFADPGATAFNALLTLASDFNNSLALRADGTVVGWGDNTFGQTNVPPGLVHVTAVAAGIVHSLALRDDGTIATWGNNDYGQRLIPNDLTATSISASFINSTLLRPDGTVLVVGDNSYGGANVPTGLTNVASISSSAVYILALRNDGTVAAWGGAPPTYPLATVPSGLSNVVAVASGALHNLTLCRDGTITVWGDNSLGQTNIPPGLTNVVAVSAGIEHSLALRADGTVVAWGDNSYGQTNVPTGLSNVVALSASSTGSYALRGDGSVVTWGTVPVGMPADLGNLPVTVTGQVKANVAGSYILTYTSTNAFGGISQSTRTVSITTNGVASVQWTGVTHLPDGNLRLSFNNAANEPFTVLASTNLTVPILQWTLLGAPTETTPGHYEFTDTQATNQPQLFYLIRSP